MEAEQSRSQSNQEVALLERLRAQRAETLAKVERLTVAITALESVLGDLAESATEEARAGLGSDEVVSAPESGDSSGESRGSGAVKPVLGRPPTQLDLLVQLAEGNGGVIDVTDARDSFLQAGVSRSKPRDVYAYIHRMLRASDQFQQISAGTFRLVAPESPTSD